MKGGITLTGNLLFKVITFVVIAIIVLFLVLLIRGETMDIFQSVKNILELF